MIGRFIRQSNGWQRLWLVSTVCLGLYSIAYLPLSEADRIVYTSDYWDTVAAFEKPECRDTQTAPLSTLHNLPIGDCTGIYVARRDREPMSEPTPYTLEIYHQRQSEKWWRYYRAHATYGIIATLFVSAFVYLCGWIIGWIYRGFRKGAQS
jgi:hypothetical protein